MNQLTKSSSLVNKPRPSTNSQVDPKLFKYMPEHQRPVCFPPDRWKAPLADSTNKVPPKSPKVHRHAGFKSPGPSRSINAKPKDNSRPSSTPRPRPQTPNPNTNRNPSHNPNPNPNPKKHSKIPLKQLVGPASIIDLSTSGQDRAHTPMRIKPNPNPNPTTNPNPNPNPNPDCCVRGLELVVQDQSRRLPTVPVVPETASISNPNINPNPNPNPSDPQPDESVSEVVAMLENLRIAPEVKPTIPDECLTLAQYVELESKGEVAYRGKGTVQDKYNDGWLFNINTRRWVKAQKSNDQIHAKLEAAEKVRDGLEQLYQKIKTQLATPRKGVSSPPQANPNSNPTPNPNPNPSLAFLVLDTNVLMGSLPFVQSWVRTIQRIESHVKVVVPRAVMMELDGLKNAHEAKSKTARDAIRFLGQVGPTSLCQADHEMYRDDMYHSEPHKLRADDSILNCCLYFARVLKARVVLVSKDIVLRMRARENGIESDAPENLNIHVLCL